MLLRILSAQKEDRKLNMNLSRKRRRIHPTFLFFSFVICLSFVIGAQSSFAQTTGSGTLRGIVKDQRGAVLPNATVTLVSERKEERKATTNDDGVYVFS